MDINNIKHVYLLGIGGIGMSGLARYFQKSGCAVYGYDKTTSELTTRLEQEGITIVYEDNVALIPIEFESPTAQSLVIYTPAVPQDLQIKRAFIDRGFEVFKRSEVLGFISASKFTIGVAGTHGKTTTSSMIAHILKDSGYDCSAFLGGISSNYDTNVLFGTNNVIVVEADEYDRSFLTLHPSIAVVTSADADHLDIYGTKEHLTESFQMYLDRVVSGGKSIVKSDLPFVSDISYALGEGKADAYATNIEVKYGEFYFDFINKAVHIRNIKLGIAGIHNVENAVAAISVALLLGIHPSAIVEALSNFRGVKRRFEYIIRDSKCVFIDDYAHHPEELRAFLSSVRKLYPSKKLTVIFQPHLYSRTRDFVEEFAEVLGLADQLWLMDIYPARELPIEGVTSDWLLSKVKITDKKVVSREEIFSLIETQQPELIMTVGAGDIDRLVKPLKALLQK